MAYILIKYLITAGIIVLVSEIAKISDKVGAIIIALPLMTIIALLWLYYEGASVEKLSNHMYYTFWYVLPTLPMFIAFPSLITRWWFWSAFGISIWLTLVIFFIYVNILKKFGINLI